MSDNKQIIDEIVKDINAFFVNNDKYTKRDFETALSVAGKNAYDKVKGKGKGKKDGEEKPKKELSDYQIFMKEQMVLLKAREDAKEEGEEKVKPKDLMKEIGELWKQKKSNN